MRSDAPRSLSRATRKAEAGRLSLKWELPPRPTSGDGADATRGATFRAEGDAQAAASGTSTEAAKYSLNGKDATNARRRDGTPVTILHRRCADQLCADRHQPSPLSSTTTNSADTPTAQGTKWHRTLLTGARASDAVESDGSQVSSSLLLATAVLEDLAPGAYEVLIDGGGGEGDRLGDPELFRVAGNTTVPTEIYRVSEYTYVALPPLLNSSRRSSTLLYPAMFWSFGANVRN